MFTHFPLMVSWIFRKACRISREGQTSGVSRRKIPAPGTVGVCVPLVNCAAPAGPRTHARDHTPRPEAPIRPGPGTAARGSAADRETCPNEFCHAPRPLRIGPRRSRVRSAWSNRARPGPVWVRQPARAFPVASGSLRDRPRAELGVRPLLKLGPLFALFQLGCCFFRPLEGGGQGQPQRPYQVGGGLPRWRRGWPPLQGMPDTCRSGRAAR